MAIFNQHNEHVDHQENIVISSGEPSLNKSELISEMKKLIEDINIAQNNDIIDSNTCNDAKNHLYNAIQQTQKEKPSKTSIVEYLLYAKNIINDFSAATALIEKLSELINKIVHLWS